MNSITLIFRFMEEWNLTIPTQISDYLLIILAEY